MGNRNELRLVELIEDHTSRLSPEGRELWESMERLIETSRPSVDLEAIRDVQVDLMRQTRGLPREEQVITAVLSTLTLGLRASSVAEDRWGVEVADKFRIGTVTKAAHDRADFEDRAVTPLEDMTVDEALDLLAEPYSPTFG